MLTFKQYQYLQALEILGLETKSLYPYQELITSELNYLNHYLNYLNDEDMNHLLAIYDHPRFVADVQGVSQEKLGLIFHKLKTIRLVQIQLLKALYQPQPMLWQKTIEDLFGHYIEYAVLIHHLHIPSVLNEALEQMQAQKVSEGLPAINNLLGILLTPIQRLPRYGLLAKEIRKAMDSNHRVRTGNGIDFYRGIIAFERFIEDKNNELNQHIRAYEQNQIRADVSNLKLHNGKVTQNLESLAMMSQVFSFEEFKQLLARFDLSRVPRSKLFALFETMNEHDRKIYCDFLWDKKIRDEIMNHLKHIIVKYKQSMLGVFVLQSLNNPGSDIYEDVQSALRNACYFFLKEATDDSHQLVLKKIVKLINCIFHKNKLAPISYEEILASNQAAECAGHYIVESSSPYLTPLKGRSITYPSPSEKANCKMRRTLKF